MNRFKSAILVLSSSVILAGCVIDDSYSSDYYDGDSVTYSSVTTGYNRDYHHKDKRPYVRQTVVETVGTPPANNTATITALNIFLNLPKAYILICLIPISLVTYLTIDSPSQRKFSKSLVQIIIITTIFIGFVYPFSLFSSRLLFLDNSYQQANIQTINALLQDEGDYVAGIELVYNKTQPISGMRHLMAPAIQFLYTPNEELKEVMLASLYEDPNATIASVIHSMKESSVKFYVNNYRINALPVAIKNYLAGNYAHWWGSIYYYAPIVNKGSQHLTLKFTGKYFIASDAKLPVEINGKKYSPHSILVLQKGEISSNAANDYRLKLIPPVKVLYLNPDFKNDYWNSLMF